VTIAPNHHDENHAAPAWMLITAPDHWGALGNDLHKGGRPRGRKRLPAVPALKPWQPSCETCSPIVAPACGKICPDLGLVNEIMERWRTA